MSTEKTYNFPVFGTQGGGLVRHIETKKGHKYIFVEAPPKGMGLSVGDFMPDQWGIVAANDAAIKQMSYEEFGDPAGDHLLDRAMREYTHRGSSARQLD